MIVRFDRRLYSEAAVQAAAKAYADAAAIEVRSTGGWIEAEVRAARQALDEACDGDFEGEFANHALWEAGR